MVGSEPYFCNTVTSGGSALAAGFTLTRSTTFCTSTTAPVSGSMNVRPLKVSTYWSGMGWPVRATSAAMSSGVATLTRAASVSSTGTPAATSDGLSCSKVSERGSGTMADTASR